MSALRLAAASLAFASFALPLRANTYTVDAGGGGQFTDIQSAITFAQAGDVILVNAGNYGALTLDKGLVIIGYGSVVVTGTTQIVNLSSGQRAAVVHVNPSDIDISGCAGAVVLQDMNGIGTLAVLQSNDVRLARVQAVGGQVLDALTADTARVEVVDSTLHGGSPAAIGAPSDPTFPPDAGRGLALAPATRVHAARSTFDGGRGGDAYAPLHYGGNGGAGLSLAAPSEVFMVGPASHVEGGAGGLALYETYECLDDGAGACGVTGAGDVHDSGATIVGGYTNQFHFCSNPTTGQDQGYYQPAFCGPNEFPVSPADPSLQLIGTPSAGASVAFTVYGEPGASAVLNLGRNMILVATPGVDIERLAPANRVIPLGTIPGSGSVTRNVLLPASFTPGLLFVAQAEVTGTNGLRRTNSTPIIVR